MQKKQQRYITKGMRRDLSISKTNNEYSYDNRNIRITTNNNENFFTISKESGNDITNTRPILGIVLGFCVLDTRVVIFTKDNDTDYIYLFSPNNINNVLVLFRGKLNFNIEYPIECIGNIETDNIQKVYWTDNLNQPRFIIVPIKEEDNCLPFPLVLKEDLYTNKLLEDPTYFDFSGDMNLNEEIQVEKVYNNLGSFPSGTIQYCWNYYNKFGKETNIADVTPIYYMTMYNRAGSPEETTTQSFRITINNVDTKYEYIKVYSIQRTSENGTPIVHKVMDCPTQSTITILDTNKNHSTITPTDLYFIGGKSIVTKTITYKDNTLFAGNYSNNNHIITECIKDDFLAYYIENPNDIIFEEVPSKLNLNTKQFENKFQLDNSQYDITSLKEGEHYVIGIQGQYRNGEYSNPIFIKDVECNIKLNRNTSLLPKFKKIILKLIIPNHLTNKLKELGIVNIRPLIIHPSINTSRFVCQGVLNPTIYNVEDRIDNSPYSQSSWFYRPILFKGPSYQASLDNSFNVEYRHGHSLPHNRMLNNEIASNTDTEMSARGALFDKQIGHNYKNRYIIDSSLFTIDSPECTSNINVDNTDVVVTGIIPITGISSNMRVNTENGTHPLNEEFRSKEIGKNLGELSSVKFIEDSDNLIDWNNASKTLANAPKWVDFVPDKSEGKPGDYTNLSGNIYRIPISPFHHIGALGGDYINNNSILKTNNRYNYKYSSNTIKFKEEDEFILPSYSPVFIDSLDNKNYLIEVFDGVKSKNIIYRGYNDKVLTRGAYSSITGKILDYYNIIVEKDIPKTDNAIQSKEIGNYLESEIKSYKGVPVTYKTNKHILVSTKPVNGILNVLPTVNYTDYLDPNNPNHAKEIELVRTIKGLKIDFMHYRAFANSIRRTVINNDEVLVLLDRNKKEIERLTNNLKNIDKYKETLSKLEKKGTKTDNGYEFTEESDRVLYEELKASLEELNSETNPLIKQLNDKFKDAKSKLTVIKDPTVNAFFGELYKELNHELKEYFNNTDIVKEDSFSKAMQDVSGTILNLLTGNNTDFKYTFKELVREIDKITKIQLLRNGVTEGSEEWNNTFKYVERFKFDDRGIDNLDTEVKWYFSIKWYIITSTISAISVINPGSLSYLFDKGSEIVNSIDSISYNSLLPIKGEDDYINYNPFYYKKSIKLNTTHTLPEYINSIIDLPNKDISYLYLGELRRKDIKLAENEKEVFNLNWYIAGYSTPITDNTMIDYLLGDVYYQRYDHIKTMPIDNGINNITEAISFMVQTRINLDSRYERQRENVDYMNRNIDNHNKFNDSYFQLNNFFSYNSIDSHLLVNSFPTNVTWTLPHIAGSPIDKLTSITLTNTLDLEGSRGVLNKIIKHNNNILFFQDNGIGNIPYNSRVQIPVSDGVPIQITNGMKVEGKVYISEILGCQNKWSVCKGNNGIYFIDNNSNSLYRIDNGLTNISDKEGFRLWTQNSYSAKEYNPNEFGNIITFYDEGNHRLYINNNKESLVFNELLNTFESFYDYKSLYSLFNVGGNLYSIIKGNSNIWKHGALHTSYYGDLSEFSIEWKVNSEGMNDKIFTNVEFRADAWDINNVLLNTDINRISVHNEYQSSSIPLRYNNTLQTNLQKKFRIWRANIPRPSITRRVRNPWINIKLSSSLTNNRNEIHDLTVTYYE